jgi:hypothetical protein
MNFGGYTVVPDHDWPKTYRVHMPDGRLTDMINLTRAQDAARTLAQAISGSPMTLIPIIASTGQCIGHLLASRAGTWRCFNAADVELGTFPTKEAAVADLNRQAR